MTTNDENTKLGKFKKFSRFMEGIFKKILFWVFWNPLLIGALCFIVGARLFETGFYLSKGANVRISGKCMTEKQVLRTDLVQDQIIVSKINNDVVEGVLRKTREFVSCKTDDVALDVIGPIADLFKKNIDDTPALTKVIFEEKRVFEFENLKNKELSISGTCRNVKNETLDPFMKRIVTVTNVKESTVDKGAFYIYGIRDDKVSLVCDSKDISYEIVDTKTKDLMQQSAESVAGELDNSLVGQKVFISGICFPDARAYKGTGSKPMIPAYNMTKTGVEVIEEKRDEKGQLLQLAGSIISKQVSKLRDGTEISMFGHKIVCSPADYPINVVRADDPNLKVEE
jgi:hypothetical protein